MSTGTIDPQQLRETMLSALAAGEEERLAERLAELRAADIADAFALMSDEERSQLLFALPPRVAAEVIILLDEAVRSDVVEEMDDQALTNWVAELAPDDAADVLAELPEEQSAKILEEIPAEKSEQIEELLEYAEDSAGGIMTTDVIALPETATVADAVERIRSDEEREDLHEIYTLDDAGRPVGTVPLTRLVIRRPHVLLRDIADPDPVTVSAADDQETVLQIIRKYDVPSAAVVNRVGRLVGRITHDDLMDVAEEEAEEDLLRIAGTDATELESRSIFHAARIRLTVLLPCMLGMMVTAAVIGVSKARFELALFGALSMFVPLVGAMSGNSGVQVSTLIVRGLATGELAAASLTRALIREGRIILVMAPICGVVAWGLVTVILPVLARLEHEPPVPHAGAIALSVGVAMTCAILWSAVLGIALPFAFRRIGVDPAIASGPLVTTANDFCSVTVYMVISFGIHSWRAGG